MKNLSLWLLAGLLVTACAQPGKDTPSPTPAPPEEVSSVVREQAAYLSQAYANWKKETEQIAWRSEDPQAFEIAQAYLLALHAQRDLGSSRIDVLVWLLESFKNIKNPSASSAEMVALAKQYINKELNL